MKSAFKKYLFIVGLILLFAGILGFISCLCSSFLIWHPGQPSEIAQILITIAAACLPISFVGMFIVSID